MSCLYCGSQYCAGTCLQACGQVGQLNIQQQQGVFGQAAILNQPQPFILQAGGGVLGNWPVMDTSLNEFLSVIEDKTDTDACMAFLEKQRTLHKSRLEQMEKIRKQFEDDFNKAEQEFISKCLKYRPSITPEILERIKKLKAFY